MNTIAKKQLTRALAALSFTTLTLASSGCGVIEATLCCLNCVTGTSLSEEMPFQKGIKELQPKFDFAPKAKSSTAQNIKSNVRF